MCCFVIVLHALFQLLAVLERFADDLAQNIVVVVHTVVDDRTEFGQVDGAVCEDAFVCGQVYDLADHDVGVCIIADHFAFD